MSMQDKTLLLVSISARLPLITETHTEVGDDGMELGDLDPAGLRLFV